MNAFTSTDESALHQFGTVCGDDIFVFRFKNVVSINIYIQIESHPDSTTLALQVQALVTIVEELTRQNQEMRLQLQQEENRSRPNQEDEGNSYRRSDHRKPTTPDEQIGRASCRERVCQYV